MKNGPLSWFDNVLKILSVYLKIIVFSRCDITCYHFTVAVNKRRLFLDPAAEGY